MFLYNNRRGALAKWKQKRGPHATYGSLIRVFEYAGYKDLADFVKQITLDLPDSGLYYYMYVRSANCIVCSISAGFHTEYFVGGGREKVYGAVCVGVVSTQCTCISMYAS